jgi:hypothetical protein
MPVMGLLRVPAHLTGPTGQSETVDVLVDTGATFLVVPRALADRLEFSPTRTCPIQTAGGREASWPLAEVRLRLDGDEPASGRRPGGPAPRAGQGLRRRRVSLTSQWRASPSSS